MKIDIKFCFVLFCVVFEEILYPESVAAEKTATFCLEFTFSSFVYFLCVGIPILKIVLSDADMCDFWCHSLEIKFSFVMSSPGRLGMVNG